MILLDAWRRWRAASKVGPVRRWVVLDVETSGLDTRRDSLIAIAALALEVDDDTLRIVLGDSFEVVLRQPDQPPDHGPDRANILLHGIGVGEQSAGAEPQQALADFERWLSGAPLIAFHAAFDEAVLRRAMQDALGHSLCSPWVDLQPVASALLPAARASSLDDWLTHFGIECAARHQAAADTLATADLLLQLWPLARRQMPDHRFVSLQRLAAQGRWLQH